MPLQNFVDKSLPTIKAAWLNALDAFYTTLFNSATTPAQARTALGSTATGDALYTAASVADARTALGITTPGSALVTAATAAAQRTALGSTTVGDAVFTAISQAAAQSALGLSSGTYLPLAGGTLTGPINETIVTINSHPTTADIWGATASDVINWHGVYQTSAFPAAPVAGARRLLICDDACSFITGANMKVRGIVGNSKVVTMKAGAFVWVTALTTTSFQIDYALDGSFTLSASTGFTTVPTVTVYYSVNNGVASLSTRASALTGTSNSTQFLCTGFPPELGSTFPTTTYLRGFAGLDNTSTKYDTVWALMDGTPKWDLSPSINTTSWTNSGTKTLYGFEVTYRLF